MDNRADFTKTDWEMWVAAMEDDTVVCACRTVVCMYVCIHSQFEAITKAVYKFANETPDRVPFSDWLVLNLTSLFPKCFSRYYTSTGKVQGFRARPVIGGLYAKMLFKIDV